MADDREPDERIVQIAATGEHVYALTSAGRVFAAARGRRALGWTLLPPITQTDEGAEKGAPAR